MATLKAYRRAAIERAGRVVGRVLPITALAGQTVTVARMATGGLSSATFEGDWLIRSDTAAAADRERKCAQNGATLAFTSSTGVFGHAGTAYADTTATGESLELLKFPVQVFDDAVQVALQRLRRADRFEIPTSGSVRYSLAPLTWVEEPSDILRVTHRGSPVLTRNRKFEKWNGYEATGGNLQPDDWTIAGANGTVTRSAVSNRQGTYTAALLRSGTTVTLQQAIPLLWTGVSGDSLRGRDITAVLVVTASSASQVRVQVLEDGVVVASSSYHSGGGKAEELTVTRTVAATVDSLAVQVSHEVNGTVYIDDCYAMVGSLSDAVRRDSWEETEVIPEFDQSQAGLEMILPARGPGAQYIVHSARSYPTFDATRVAAGTADADVSDAPTVPVVAGLLERLFEQLASDANQRDTTQYERLAEEWAKRADNLRSAHLYVPSGASGGANLPRPTFDWPTVSRGW